MNNYDILLNKLDQFVRKYYKNQLIKGGLYVTALVIGLFLVFVFAEYFGRFNQSARLFFFIAFLLTSLGTIIKWLVVPLLKLNRLGKTITYPEASKLIGEHFPEVNDKLLNTIQLQGQLGIDDRQSTLLALAIDQRIKELAPVRFTAAVDFRKNKKYLKFALPPLIVLFILFVVSPSILKESTERIVSFNKDFVPVSLVSLQIQNDKLEAVKQADFTLSVMSNGQVLPNNVYIEADGTRFKLDKIDKNLFGFTFKSLQHNTTFKLIAEDYVSESFTLKVLQKPVLNNFTVQLDYPGYLNRASETLANQGDFTIPQGTKVTWRISAQETDEVWFGLNEKFLKLNKVDRTFNFSQKLMGSASYQLSASNKIVGAPDTLSYGVTVIADQYPQISVDEKQDSLSAKLYYFSGRLTDDYGFSSLYFYYKNSLEGESSSFVKKEIKIELGTTATQFFYVWNLYDMEVKPGDKFQYFFEVADNDGVNGAKKTRSAVSELKIPTANELDKQQQEKSESIKANLSQGIKDAKALQKDLQKLQRDLLNDKKVDWKEKKQLKDLLDQQKKLENKIEDIRKENELKNFQQNEFSQQEKAEILQKKEQLEELFNKLMTPEMKELYKQMEELLNKADQEKLLEKMEELQLKNQDVEKEMDRMLDLFKQLEFEEKLTKNIDELKELAKEQKELAQQTKDSKLDQNKLQEKQDKLSDDFKKLSEEMKDLEKKAEELKNDMSPAKTEQKQEEIKNQQQKASDQLDNKQNKKASENQEQSAEKMEEMADQLEKMMSEAQEEKAGEDMDAIRQLLDNIIKLSINQERLMQNLKPTSGPDPKYVTYTQLQKNYKDDAKIIKDSLFALSKRVPQLQSVVNREISSINRNMESAIEFLAERQTPRANANQQYVMTSLNNLALILDAALKQMQEDIKNKNPGSASCNKPGKGQKPKPGNLSQMQDKLAKQLEQMRKEMEKGKSPGKQKPGEGGPGGMSEQLAKMAAQQAAVRRQLEKMAQELNKEGKGEGNKLKEIAKQMEETEKDIVNRNIKPETLKRQQEIMTRLLEHEKADKERDEDNKRESKQPLYPPISNPQSYFDYQKKKLNEVEMLKTMPAGLKPYYKSKSENYLNTGGKQ